MWIITLDTQISCHELVARGRILFFMPLFREGKIPYIALLLSVCRQSVGPPTIFVHFLRRGLLNIELKFGNRFFTRTSRSNSVLSTKEQILRMPLARRKIQLFFSIHYHCKGWANIKLHVLMSHVKCVFFMQTIIWKLLTIYMSFLIGWCILYGTGRWSLLILSPKGSFISIYIYTQVLPIMYTAHNKGLCTLWCMSEGGGHIIASETSLVFSRFRLP